MKKPCSVLQTANMYAITTVSWLMYKNPNAHVSPSKKTSTTAPLIQVLEKQSHLA